MSRHTTSRQDAAMLFARLAEASRSWQVGDACRSAHRGINPDTTVAAIDGDCCTMADGSTCHRTNMRHPRGN